MDLVLLLVIAAGLLAVLYGVVQTAVLLRASPGNAKMQEIAAAIQEGAQAYLARQLGLHPLAVHLDNGWNSELAVSNIETQLPEIFSRFYSNPSHRTCSVCGTIMQAPAK